MVVLNNISNYDYELVKQAIKSSLEEYDFLSKIDSEKRVFIKLNCVCPALPDTGITTHPVVLKAVLDLVKEKTNKIIVGDNPAIRDLIPTLKKCGLYQVIMDEEVQILDGTLFTNITNSNPIVFSTFEVSKQMVDCDVLINLPKIKTHSLAYMTCAQKNFFGLIYGLNKAGWHTKASNPLEFGNALTDLYGAFIEALKGKDIIHICDGIIGLEGEGPSTGGKAIKSHCLLVSDNAIEADRVALEVAHLDYSKLFINQIAASRGYGENDLSKIEIKGASLSEFDDVKFLAPKDSMSNVGLRFLKVKFIKNIILEHPSVQKEKCIKCGQCATICPPKAMTIKKGEYPKLSQNKCIRCWCCAEVCPQNAIDKSKRPLLGRIILKTDK